MDLGSRKLPTHFFTDSTPDQNSPSDWHYSSDYFQVSIGEKNIMKDIEIFHYDPEKLPMDSVWIQLKNIDDKSNYSDLLPAIKLQTERRNIITCETFYGLENSYNDIIIGLVILDKKIRSEIKRGIQKLIYFWRGKELKYHVFNDNDDLIRYMRKKEIEMFVKEQKIFGSEFVKPLPIMHLQGLAYYEFDHSEICPKTLLVLCGVPPSVTDEVLIQFFIKKELPIPLGILRNPKEDPTCIRLNFRNESEVDMIQSKGLELEMGTHNKPIILMGVSDRNFDYLAELNKYQVLILFKTVIPDQEKALLLHYLENKYGKIADLTNNTPRSLIITFLRETSAFKCSIAQEKRAELQDISIPVRAYMLSGELSVLKVSENKGTLPQRPAKIIPADPNSFKMLSSEFECKDQLKKRYEKCFFQKYCSKIIQFVKILDEAKSHESSNLIRAILPNKISTKRSDKRKSEIVHKTNSPANDFLYISFSTTITLKDSILNELDTLKDTESLSTADSIGSARKKIKANEEKKENSKIVKLPISIVKENIEKIKKLVYTNHIVKKFVQSRHLVKEEYIEQENKHQKVLLPYSPEFSNDGDNESETNYEESIDCYVDMGEFV